MCFVALQLNFQPRNENESTNSTRPKAPRVLITHISEREQALQRENERLLNTIRVQAAAIEAQRECIAELDAQPVQEPVAWMYQCTADKSGPVLLQKKKNWAESGTGLWIETPLYAAPVQPAPLTDEQIDELAGYAFSDYAWKGTSVMMTHFARAIETAIKGGAT